MRKRLREFYTKKRIVINLLILIAIVFIGFKTNLLNALVIFILFLIMEYLEITKEVRSDKRQIVYFIAIVIISFIFNGCAADKAYNIAKAGYKGAKVVAQNVPMSDDKREKLKKVDKGATTYDKARTAVRNQLDDAGKKQVADTSKVTEP